MEKATSFQQEKGLTFERYWQKFRGQTVSPLKVNGKDALTGLIGGFTTIFLLLYLTNVTSTQWLMAPFGASCVLVFAAWNAPLSQPRNIIGGHLISTAIGLMIFHLFGSEPWTLALGVGLAIACMMLTKTTHPPAGANPIIVILGGYSWSYLITPVFIGAIVIVIVALLLNNLCSDRSYPVFWK